MDNSHDDPSFPKNLNAGDKKSKKEKLAAQGLMQHNQTIPIWLKGTLQNIANGCKTGKPKAEVLFNEFLNEAFPGFPEDRKKLVRHLIAKCNSTGPIDKPLHEIFLKVTTEATRRRFQEYEVLEKKRPQIVIGEAVLQLDGWKSWLVMKILKLRIGTATGAKSK